MIELLKKWNNYTPGDVKFINNNRDKLYHKLYIEYVRKNINIKSILEVGPGELEEYFEISNIRDIDYSVIEISEPFIKFIKNTYPEVKIIKTIIEKFVNPPILYDLVRLSNVLEHTYPVSSAIKNIILCAKQFHITLFKWNNSGNNLIPTIRKDSYNMKYFSTKYPIIMLFDEILKHGTIDSVNIIVNKTNEIISFKKYWEDNNFSDLVKRRSTHGHRIIIQGYNNNCNSGQLY